MIPSVGGAFIEIAAGRVRIHGLEGRNRRHGFSPPFAAAEAPAVAYKAPLAPHMIITVFSASEGMKRSLIRASMRSRCLVWALLFCRSCLCC